MLRSEKPQVVEALADMYRQSNSVIVTHYHGLTVGQVTLLRKSLKAKGVGFRVAKNTLIKIAASKAGVSDISHLLTGPTAIAYSEDSIEAAKTIVEFAKSNQSLKVIGGIVDNQILNANDVEQLAKLPSLNELRGKIIGILQAPATKLASTVQAPSSTLARVFKAYAERN